MSLPSSPPRYDSWAAMLASIKRGETGWRVYALQAAVKTTTGARLTLDGNFGPMTEEAVRHFQNQAGLLIDGIAGPATQGKAIALIGRKIHKAKPEVPDGLLRGMAEGEGANILAATNWSVRGGVDCGTMQYRVYGPPYALSMMQVAFHPRRSMSGAAAEFLSRASDLADRAWARGSDERAKRCAVLAHNWPAGARYYADHGHAPRPTERATWVPSGTRFPDGAAVVTRQDWCEFYAMSGPHGEGRITKYVEDWS